MTNRYLPTPLRRALEKTVKDARLIAEEGARDAIRRLGVADSKAPSYLADEEKELRRRLRAHARALGDVFDRSDETQETKRLVEAAAYAHWHRMLFARFLAERGLLRNPEYDLPVSLEDCRELAEAEGLTDPWVMAERYAASMLPAVFRIDDPVLSIEVDPVQTQKVHRLVTGLDAEVFQAEDSLGWTYQFWRAAEKDAVNKSGVKIGADELPAVTQLFTEPYMVRFLLHNTLGAWWAGKVLAADPALAQTAADEIDLRAACSLPDYSFDMLRFVREGEDSPWRPAAGTFPGWPKEIKAITMLDPCCGSGHFLTEALAILAALRQAEEHLAPADAVAAVLRDNLHGLEIDGRCVQIAAFAAALSAWRIGGWQTLPLPHIAWVGAPPPLPKREFVALGGEDASLRYALAAFHDLFSEASILGSLIEPSTTDLFEREKLQEIDRHLDQLLKRGRSVDANVSEGTIAARGMLDATSMLLRNYVLVATNVPFLGRINQSDDLKFLLNEKFSESGFDLATAFTHRNLNFVSRAWGVVASVLPQNWQYQTRYKSFRAALLDKRQIKICVELGGNAFQQPVGVNVGLTIFDLDPEIGQEIVFLSTTKNSAPAKKEAELREIATVIRPLRDILQIADLTVSPDAIIADKLLLHFASSYQGMMTGDGERFFRKFWEVSDIGGKWDFVQGANNSNFLFSGFSSIVCWENGRGQLHVYAAENRHKLHDMHESGNRAWGKSGIIINQQGDLKATPYYGAKIDGSASVIIPKERSALHAIWNSLSSKQYHDDVRKIDKKRNVTNANLLKVPFSGSKMHEVTTGAMPEPLSSFPSEWIFHGHPAHADVGVALQTALSRLCGCRWPAETDPDMRLSDEARAWVVKASELPPGDNYGLLGVPAVAGEKPLADRLRAYLSAAFGAEWSDALERRLVAKADETLDKKTSRETSLEFWVRDRAFRQHCALFGQRPFLWHISDGSKDGFSVFVRYHHFDQANLRKLTYTLLGDWLARAKAENNALRYEKGRELQQKLEKILEGEKPYDIFVRWKSLAQQPLGWDPDLDDGVRQNIRPFIMAGVLTRDLSKTLKGKDRGKDVASAPWYDVFNGERRNDHHTTLAEKRAAREAAAKPVEAAK